MRTEVGKREFCKASAIKPMLREGCSCCPRARVHVNVKELCAERRLPLGRQRRMVAVRPVCHLVNGRGGLAVPAVSERAFVVCQELPGQPPHFLQG